MFQRLIRLYDYNTIYVPDIISPTFFNPLVSTA